jgi:D-alanyl-D-alanine carboxypeptidase
MELSKDAFIAQVRQIHQALKIPDNYAIDKKIPLHIESISLVEIKDTNTTKTHKLTAPAAKMWSKMNDAAKSDGINLIMISSFRSIDHQRALIERKLENGQTILEALTILAPPGYSEHHSGRAIDLTTDDCPPCVEKFETTDAFNWLQKTAHHFKFSLSYPRNNPYGFIYEPWHWAFNEN